MAFNDSTIRLNALLHDGMVELGKAVFADDPAAKAWREANGASRPPRGRQ